MKQIILARHTQTLAMTKENLKNPKDFDSELSALGKNQAKEMCKYLDKLKYEAIFTSIYKRTIQTAGLCGKKSLSTISTNAFNEYYVRPSGEEVETVDMGIVRTMSKVYSMFDTYQNILIVGHSSINKTILQSITNISYQKAGGYFNKLGEIQVLRYDWEKGDKVWKIIDSFTPKQS